MYHFPAQFNAAECRNDLDAKHASILLRSVHENLKNTEDYVVPAYYLFITLKGQKIFHVTQGPDQDHPNISVDPGDILLIAKGACIRCEVSRLDDNSFDAVMFLINEDFIANLLKKYTLRFDNPTQKRSLCRFESTPFLKACIESLLPYFMQRSPIHQALIELKMEELLLNLLEGEQLDQVLAVFADALSSSKREYLMWIEKWIEDSPSIEQMAACLHQSPSHFKQEFKQIFGESPARYLQHKRLEKARHLILTSDQSLTQIALETGFENPSHFSQVFRKHFGFTPNHLRKSTVS